ncbi:uncharacterized protein PV09_04518 [Verruconis gallopava]|uniref:Major facilitator superfamily (MFS) profile domain-containing protein n=1 Tax=Verruconis gallopava TaxID=253628 RepID=A0A0D2ACI8_9PEZI|nr:uncharacterized protein PV09_04518 [Verruconis gallopava]KIW04210.1 hypothetical protein PV09_04518 [Verruconis gallopava]
MKSVAELPRLALAYPARTLSSLQFIRAGDPRIVRNVGTSQLKKSLLSCHPCSSCPSSLVAFCRRSVGPVIFLPFLLSSSMVDKVDIEQVGDTRHVDDIATQTHEDPRRGTGVHAEHIDASYWFTPHFLGSCAAIVFVANSLFFGYAIPVNILSVIEQDLGTSTDISLVTLINTLCQGVVNLLVGSISDIVGRRWFLIGGQIFGVVGSVLGGSSKNVQMLVGASVFTGIGAACQLTYPLLVMEIVPNKYRGWAQGAITMAVLPSLGFGPIVGRAIIESSSWRWTYWVAAIINGIGLALLFVFYHPPNFSELQRRKSAWQQAKEIDYFGFVIYAGSVICLLLALTWGGQQDPWSSAKIVALLTVGCVVLLAFFAYETFMPLAQPLLPVSLFKIRNYSIAVVVGSIGQMTYYAFNVLWPTQSTLLYSTNVITVGWLGCTTGVALAVGEIAMGPLLKRIGHIKIQLLVAVVGLCVFGGLMAAANEHREGLAIGCTIMSGFFVGWIELICIVMAGLVCPPEEIGVAQTFFSSTRAVTGTVATSVYLAIYDGRLATNLPKKVLEFALNAGLPSSSSTALLNSLANDTTAAFEQVPGMSANILTAIGSGHKSAYAASLSTVYLSSLAFGGSALIASFFVTDINKYFTSHVNKTVAGRSGREGEKGKELDELKNDM